MCITKCVFYNYRTSIAHFSSQQFFYTIQCQKNAYGVIKKISSVDSTHKKMQKFSYYKFYIIIILFAQTVCGNHTHNST